VVEWGRTPRQLVRTTLQAEHAVADKALGVIFNKVDTRKLAQYEPYCSQDSYYADYGQYPQRAG
jgi:succinoglycan biosynthesis transport protein ExoP